MQPLAVTSPHEKCRVESFEIKQKREVFRMATVISVGEIRKFYNENRSALAEEYRMVAEEPDAGVEVYITDDGGVPYFVVEVDGTNEYEAKASSETEIEKVYSQLLNLYICETDENEVLDADDIERMQEIRNATIEYLSILLECEPEECFDDDCIEEITSAFEEYLYDAYGFSIRHPIVDGNKVIQYPYSEEV